MNATNTWSTSARLGATALGLGAWVGCGGGGLQSDDEHQYFVWNVEVIGHEDLCHDPPVEPTDPNASFEFVIEYTAGSSNISLFVGEEQFATGTLRGCDIEYESVVWSTSTQGYEYKWKLHGQATIRQGGTSCDLPDGVDWQGTEDFEIVSTTNEDVVPGCTYSLTEEGTYVGPLE